MNRFTLQTTRRRTPACANVLIGVVGALLGGFVVRKLFGANLGNNGYLASLGVALVGSCVVIFAWKSLSRGRA